MRLTWRNLAYTASISGGLGFGCGGPDRTIPVADTQPQGQPAETTQVDSDTTTVCSAVSR
jgi:hypothetical protein